MKKNLMIVLVVIMAMMAFTGCTESTNSNVVQAQAQEQLAQQANQQVGMPTVKNFFEKKMMRDIIELRDDSKLVTYAYTQTMNGKFVYIGQCIGYGLPYSTQYTNPEIADGSSCGYYTLPQADPNALFSPDGVSATWVMLVNESTGKPEIMYCEPDIMIKQSKMPARLCEGWSLPSNY